MIKIFKLKIYKNRYNSIKNKLKRTDMKERINKEQMKGKSF